MISCSRPMLSGHDRYRKPVSTFRRSCLYPLDVFGAEQAVGLDHQDDDQDVERRDLVEIAPVQILAVDILGDVLEQPDDDATEHGATDRVEPAEDGRREYLDAVGRKARGNAVDDADHDAGDRGDG